MEALLASSSYMLGFFFDLDALHNFLLFISTIEQCYRTTLVETLGEDKVLFNLSISIISLQKNTTRICTNYWKKVFNFVNMDKCQILVKRQHETIVFSIL